MMKMEQQIAKWKANARISVSPEVAAKAIDEVREKAGPEGFTPRQLVNAARAKRHPLHNEFVWDDAEAAELHRTERAKYLVRCLEITVMRTAGNETRSVTVRKYTSIGNGAGHGKASRYRKTREVLSDEHLRREVLLKVWHQLLGLKRQYEDLQEFASVWSAIDDAEQQMVAV